MFFTDCKSAAFRFDGSNPSSPTKWKSPRAATALGLFSSYEHNFFNRIKVHKRAFNSTQMMSDLMSALQSLVEALLSVHAL